MGNYDFSNLENKTLTANIEAQLFSDNQLNIIKTLLDQDQSHLFEQWEEPSKSDEKKKAFLDSVIFFDQNYPGGIKQYIQNGIKLLEDSKQGVNPFEGFTPEVPTTIDLTEINGDYLAMEKVGTENIEKLGFVMVAGGLGERLGYPGIKIEIPFETITETSFLKLYCQYIKACESRVDKDIEIPFVIMTSGDTHEKTVQFLKDYDNFGLSDNQLHIVKQELVPALQNNQAHLALDDAYTLQLKPHGHGDIHMLIHTNGLAKKFKEQGLEYLVFIQDTNAQVTNACMAFLGTSIHHNLDFNTIGINRIPGETVGSMACLNNGEKKITVNVEYNQLEPLLKSTISPDGDMANDKGFSIFPGNTNILCIKVDSYVDILESSQGIIAEFVNPKYADDTKTTFQKPTRLETMMQDLPKLFDNSKKVGVTLMDRSWSFSAVKNNPTVAAQKVAGGSNPESATAAEKDFYQGGKLKLERAGIEVANEPTQMIKGIPFQGPQIILHPSFALNIPEVTDKFSGGGLIEKGATLKVDGEKIKFNKLTLKSGSALEVYAYNGAEVELEDIVIDNDGYVLEEIPDTDLKSVEPYLFIRGYKFNRKSTMVICLDGPGKYRVESSGKIVKL